MAKQLTQKTLDQFFEFSQLANRFSAASSLPTIRPANLAPNPPNDTHNPQTSAQNPPTHVPKPMLTRRDFAHADRDHFLCECPSGVPLAEADRRDVDTQRFAHLPFYDAQRWEVIESALREIQNSTEFTPDFIIRQISTYNQRMSRHMNRLTALDVLLQENWRGGAHQLLNSLLPKIAGLALSLPDIVRKPIPLLLSSSDASLTLSRRQVAALLANAFFCTFSGQHRDKRRFNLINFGNLFCAGNVEKLKCVLWYFDAVTSKDPSGTISIVRHQAAAPAWKELDISIGRLVAQGNGKIEDEGRGKLCVDFANEYIGGGVLSTGCVQEEILFVIYPELLVSCLVCEQMAANEAILIVGAQRFSNYTGYGFSFRWSERTADGDESKCDQFGRAFSEFVAIDALNFGDFVNSERSWRQFSVGNIDRELNKAFAGFSMATCQSNVEIATGNWGCGVFAGDLYLKSIVQLIAASVVERPLYYLSFGNNAFAVDLDRLVQQLHENGVKIGTLYLWVCEYGQHQKSREESGEGGENLFEFIRREKLV